MAGPTDGGVSRGFPRSELGLRVVSAVVLVIVALVAAYAGGWLFAVFWLIAGIATALEWIAITRAAPGRTLSGLAGGTLAILTLLYLVGAGWIAILGIIAAGGVAMAAVAASPRDRAWALAGLLYAALIVLVPPLVRDHPKLGIDALLWMFAVVWGTDIAAFFTGRSLGGPKLWPRVSPKKTWSGFCGGLAAAILAGVAVAAVSRRLGGSPPLGLWAVAVLSAVASVLSQLGDLAESALKRAFGVKDSGRTIPGHGGVLDRIDGFWAVCLLVGLLLVTTAGRL